MIKACIFPRSLKRQGQIFKRMNCAKIYVYDHIDI